MKYGVIQRNGVPASTKATMTEHFIRHGDQLTLVTIVDDPVYLEEPFIRTSHWVRSSNITVDQRWLFEVVDEVAGHSLGYVPHYPLGTRQDGYAKKHGLPFEATQGGKATIYPEYELKLKEMLATRRSGAFVNALKRATMRLAVLVATLACSVVPRWTLHAQQPVATVPLDSTATAAHRRRPRGPARAGQGLHVVGAGAQRRGADRRRGRRSSSIRAALVRREKLLAAPEPPDQPGRFGFSSTPTPMPITSPATRSS